VLKEVCLVVRQSEDNVAKWELARQATGAVIGCSNEKLEASHHILVKSIKKNDLIKHMKDVKIRFRSIDDPAI